MTRCPKCHSNDLALRANPAQLECLFCGHEFAQPDKTVAIYHAPTPGGATCPSCGAPRARVKSAPAASNGTRMRYHECACGHRFPSIERVKGNNHA